MTQVYKYGKTYKIESDALTLVSGAPIAITGGEAITGDVAITGNESVSGNSSVTGNVTVTGTSTFNGPTTFANATNNVNNGAAMRIQSGGSIQLLSGSNLTGQTGSQITFPSLDGSPSPLSISDSGAQVNKIVSTSGAYTLANSNGVSYMRIADQVIFNIFPNTAVAQNIAVAAPTLTLSGVFNAGYRPGANLRFMTQMKVLNVITTVTYTILTTGDVQIATVSGANFGVGADNLIDGAMSGVFTASPP